MHCYIQFVNGDITFEVLSVSQIQVNSLTRFLLSGYYYYLYFTDKNSKTKR